MTIKANSVRDNSNYTIVSVFVCDDRRRKQRRQDPRRNKINATSIVLLMARQMTLGAGKESKLILLPLLEGFVDPDNRVWDPDGVLLSFKLKAFAKFGYSRRSLPVLDGFPSVEFDMSVFVTKWVGLRSFERPKW